MAVARQGAARIDEDASSQSNGICLAFLHDGIRLLSVGIMPGKAGHTDVPFYRLDDRHLIASADALGLGAPQN